MNLFGWSQIWIIPLFNQCYFSVSAKCSPLRSFCKSVQDETICTENDNDCKCEDGYYPSLVVDPATGNGQITCLS